MTRSAVVVGMVAALAVGGFAAQDARPAALRTQVVPPETELKKHVEDQQERTQRVERRIDLIEKDNKRLASALEKSEATVATLSRQVKTIAEAQERLARAVTVDPSGGVRITGNLRLDNNVLEDVTVINCDAEGTTGAKRQCTCPQGLIAIGLELRPLALSAYPGPATYNTALVCGRL
jgi:hypothetical protein